MTENLTVGQEVRAPTSCDYGSDREYGWCEQPAKFTVRGDGTEGTPCPRHLAWTVAWLTDGDVTPSVEAMGAIGLHDIASFRENAGTIAAGHVTRVWDKPARDPYVTISSEGRTFTRLSSQVTVTRKAGQ